MIQHFVVIYFNCWDLHRDGRNLREDWIRNRLDLMCRYTLPSLMRQTVDDFDVLVYCHPDSRQTLNTILRERGPLDRRIQFVFDNDERTERLRSGVSRVLETRIDSDDMFAPQALELIQSAATPDMEAVILQNGFLFDFQRVFSYHRESPPFYTLCPAADIWQDYDAYMDWWKFSRNVGSHLDIVNRLKCSHIVEALFMILIHSGNTSSGTELAGVGRKIRWPFTRRRVLREFELWKRQKGLFEELPQQTLPAGNAVGHGEAK